MEYVRRCKDCDVEFLTSNKKKVFCTKKCKQHFANVAHRQRNKIVYGKKICKGCGVEFTPSKRSFQIFCNRKCKDAHHSGLEKSIAQRREYLEQRRNPEITRLCLNCNGEFKTTRTLKVYCSQTCQSYYRGESEASRAYRQTDKRKEVRREYDIEWNKTNPKKREAHKLAQKIPLQPCVICGDIKSERHHFDYEQPLAVIFLCSKHHKDEHRLILQN